MEIDTRIRLSKKASKKSCSETSEWWNGRFYSFNASLFYFEVYNDNGFDVNILGNSEKDIASFWRKIKEIS